MVRENSRIWLLKMATSSTNKKKLAGESPKLFMVKFIRELNEALISLRIYSARQSNVVSALEMRSHSYFLLLQSIDNEK